MEEKAKKTMFRELYELDDEESEEEDSSNASLILKRCKITPSSPRVETGTSRDRVNRSPRSIPSFKHAVSAPLLSLLTTPASQGCPNASQSFPSTLHFETPMQQAVDTSNSVTKPGHTRTTLTPNNGKRKRGRSLEPKPASQQIFKGLSFCRLYQLRSSTL